MFLTKLLTVILSFSIVQPTMAEDPLEVDTDKPLGDVSPIEVAVSQFEKKFNKEVMLPHYVPFTPTYSGGKFNESQKQVRIDYLNSNTDDLLTVHIIYGATKIKSEESAKIVKLADDDNTKAKYIHDKELAFDFIRFKKEGLTYQIGISKNNRDDNLSDLLKVANSLNQDI